MGVDRIAALTPKQLACLRKASEFKSSKLIAHEMGITSKTVDRHIEAANRALGVGSRQQAIRLLIDSDRAVGGLSPEAISPIAEPPNSMTVPEDHTDRALVRDGDDRAKYDPSPPTPMPSEPTEDARYDLISQLKTVALIIVIAAAFVLLVGQYPAVIAAAESLADTLKSQNP